MSISMNNHESRIKALETHDAELLSFNKNTSKGHCFFKNGLQLNFGITKFTTSNTPVNVTFDKAFSNNALICVPGEYFDGIGNNQYATIKPGSLTKSGFKHSVSWPTVWCAWIAIGY